MGWRHTRLEFRSTVHNRKASFDSLLVAHVLEHMRIDEARLLLLDYLPLVKPDGRLIVIVPQQAGFRSDATHVEYLDSDRLAVLADPLPIGLVRVFSVSLSGVGRMGVSVQRDGGAVFGSGRSLTILEIRQPDADRAERRTQPPTRGLRKAKYLLPR